MELKVTQNNNIISQHCTYKYVRKFLKLKSNYFRPGVPTKLITIFIAKMCHKINSRIYDHSNVKYSGCPNTSSTFDCFCEDASMRCWIRKLRSSQTRLYWLGPGRQKTVFMSKTKKTTKHSLYWKRWKALWNLRIWRQSVQNHYKNQRKPWIVEKTFKKHCK